MVRQPVTEYSISVGVRLASTPRPQMIYRVKWVGPALLHPLDVLQCMDIKPDRQILGVTTALPLPVTHLI